MRLVLSFLLCVCVCVFLQFYLGIMSSLNKRLMNFCLLQLQDNGCLDCHIVKGYVLLKLEMP